MTPTKEKQPDYELDAKDMTGITIFLVIAFFGLIGFWHFFFGGGFTLWPGIQTTEAQSVDRSKAQAFDDACDARALKKCGDVHYMAFANYASSTCVGLCLEKI